MNNILKCVLIVFMFMCSFAYVTPSVYAASAMEDLENYEPVMDNSGKVTCEDLIGNKDDEGSFASILSDVYRMLQVGAVIYVIVVSMLNFTSAISAGDADILKKQINKFIRRLIVLVALFLVPFLLNLILSLVFGPDFLCKL